jgi:transcriptional regulator with XRE-family HTH domain
MTDQRVGAMFRFLRIRRGWRQIDVAARAGVSQSQVSRIERGHLATVTIETLRRVAAVLDLRIDVVGRWRGGDLDRLLAAGHSALYEAVATRLRGLAGWAFASEVSFSIDGERGIVDILAWHAATRSLLVIELKTEFMDVNELVGTLDRKRRLARRIAAERGWLRDAATVSAWVIVVDGSANRRRAAEHATMLGSAYPVDGRAIRTWLRRPVGAVACLSFWPNSRPGIGMAASRPIRPVRHRVRVRPTHGSGLARAAPRPNGP